MSNSFKSLKKRTNGLFEVPVDPAEGWVSYSRSSYGMISSDNKAHHSSTDGVFH